MKKVAIIIALVLLALNTNAQTYTSYAQGDEKKKVSVLVETGVKDAKTSINGKVKEYVFSHILREYGKTTIVYVLKYNLLPFSPTELREIRRDNKVLGHMIVSYIDNPKIFIK